MLVLGNHRALLADIPSEGVAYIGIDPSLTGTGVAIIIDGGCYAITLKTTPKDALPARVDYIVSTVESIISYLEDRGVLVYCGMEAVAFAAKGRIADMGYLNGAIRSALYRKRRKYIMVPPTVLKKFVTGKGNANKQAVALSCYKWSGIDDFPDDNQYDALALARIAAAEYGNPGNEPKTRLESLKKCSSDY